MSCANNYFSHGRVLQLSLIRMIKFSDSFGTSMVFARFAPNTRGYRRASVASSGPL